MTRGLTAPEITALSASAYETEEHVKITLRTPVISGNTVTYTTIQTLRYTTGSTQTDIAGDGVYVPQSYVRQFDYPEESFTLTPSTITIVFDTFNQSFIDAFDSDSKYAHTVDIFMVLKDPITKTVTARYLIFSGNVTGMDIAADTDTQSVNLRVSSNYIQFDQITGRTIADLPQVPLFQKVFWGDLQI